jgi:hypothetical protein
VPDGAIIADGEREAFFDMEHAVVLNVAAFSDFDHIIFGPQHGAEPDARIAFQADLPDQHSGQGNPEFSRLGKLWRTIV